MLFCCWFYSFKTRKFETNAKISSNYDLQRIFPIDLFIAHMHHVLSRLFPSFAVYSNVCGHGHGHVCLFCTFTNSLDCIVQFEFIRFDSILLFMLRGGSSGSNFVQSQHLQYEIYSVCVCVHRIFIVVQFIYNIKSMHYGAMCLLNAANEHTKKKTRRIKMKNKTPSMECNQKKIKNG